MKKLLVLLFLTSAAQAAVTMNEGVRGTNNTYLMTVTGSTPNWTAGGSTWTVTATTAAIRATGLAGAAGNIYAGCVDFGASGFQCGPGITGGSGQFILNQSTLQSGATAYPSFSYAGSSMSAPSGFLGNFTFTRSTGTALNFTGVPGTTQYWPFVHWSSGTSNGTFTTTSTNFSSTTLSCSITPHSTSSRIKITAQGTISNSDGQRNTYATFFRNTTSLAVGTDGNLVAGTNVAAQYRMGQTLIWTDTPNTTSATTYTVAIRTSNAAGVAQWGDNINLTSYILCEEYPPPLGAAQ